jgi:hypothetical protein
MREIRSTTDRSTERGHAVRKESHHVEEPNRVVGQRGRGGVGRRFVNWGTTCAGTAATGSTGLATM